MQSAKGAFALPKYYGTNISFEREPKNALEYLVSVRNEASQIPDIVTVAIDVNLGTGIHIQTPPLVANTAENLSDASECDVQFTMN